jgi:hypothetical protein
VGVAAVVVIAKVAHNESVLTRKAKPFRWTPICNPAVRLFPRPTAKSSAQIAVRVETAAVAAVVAVNAAKALNAMTRHAPKAALML